MIEHLPDLHLFVDDPEKVIRFQDIEFLEMQANKRILLNHTSDEDNMTKNVFKKTLTKQ